MDALGLVFGCIDLVADDHDELHFLEINQAGQFLFVEHDAPEHAAAARDGGDARGRPVGLFARHHRRAVLCGFSGRPRAESVVGIRGCGDAQQNGAIAGVSEE